MLTSQAVASSPREAAGQAYELEQQGQYVQAQEIYERLLRGLPGNSGLLWGQGRCLMELGLREPACTALVKAAAGSAVHEKMVEDIAARLILLGRPDLAERVCGPAIKVFPRSTGIMIQHGDALRALGFDEDAIALFRAILKLAPGHVGVTHSLVNSLRQIGQVEEALALARGALAQAKVPGLGRAGLLNEVAQCEDLLGRYGLAFEALSGSGAMVLDSPQAQEVESLSYLGRLASYQSWVQSNGLPPSTPDASAASPRQVFLLGFPRSGTTLLESMLSAAPGVVSSGETPLLGAALARIMSSGASLDGMLDVMGPGNSELLDQARAEYRRKREAAFGTGYEVFVDKQPMNTLYLAQIRMLFPDAGIVFCIRDPRDVCLSCFFQWFALNGTNKLFYDWQRTADFYARVMNYWFTLEPALGESVYSLRYEDLIADVPTQLRRLTDAVGIPWDDAMLSFTEANRDRVFLTPSNRAVREEVSGGRTQRWKNYPDAMAQVSHLLAPAIDRLGYT